MKFILFFITVLLSCSMVHAQSRDTTPARQHAIRIVDTLTAKDLANRNPILSVKEVDSLVDKIYVEKQDAVVPVSPVTTSKTEPGFYPIIVCTLLALLFILLFVSWKSQKKLSAQIARLSTTISEMKLAEEEGLLVHVNEEGRLLMKGEQPEKLIVKGGDKQKTAVLQTQQIVHDFEVLKKKMSSVYKVKNYPGYTTAKPASSLLNVLEMEKNIASFSYHQFVKPVTAIVDANKNNPSKIRKAEQEQLVELLVSLALFYSEYLYLRVQDLSLGGNIARRLDQFSKGEGIDPELLKPLNKEHGSRALALQMALDKMSIKQLSYPVFDETRLDL